MTKAAAPVDRVEQPEEQTKEPVIDEHYRLGGRPPLPTLASLMFGPLISQFVQGIYGVVTSMWMARAMGDLGMSAISVFQNLDNMSRAVGFFLNCAVTSKLSALFGERRESETGQVVCDLWRLSFVCGAIVPAIFLPIAKPLALWYGSAPDVVDWAFLYLAPLLGCATVTCLYLLMCGCLQAEGRSLLTGGVQIASMILNMAVLNPLFLLVFNWKTAGAAMATILAELIPAVILTVLFFRGRFAVKPEWRGLFRKFSPETLPAIRVGISQLIMQVSRSIPSIIVRKYMGLGAEHNPDATFDDAIAGFNATIRIETMTEAVRYAASMGLLPGMSYAYTSHQVDRIFWLIFHASWLNFAWGGFNCLLTAFASRYLAMSISKSETYLRWAAPMIKANGWDAPWAWIRNVVQTTLQALQYGTTATVYSFCATFFASIGATFLLYYTNDADFVRIMYGYPMSSGFAAVLGGIVILSPLRRLWKSKHAPTEDEGIALAGVEDESIEEHLLSNDATGNEC
jgi:Na+-driven multidrug efflux pump